MAQQDYQDQYGNWYQPDNPWENPQPAPGVSWDWPNNDWSATPGTTLEPGPQTETPQPDPITQTPRPGGFVPPTNQAYPGMPSYGPVPQFRAPGYEKPPAFSYADYQAPEQFTYENWKAPSVDEAMSDPGYQFRRDQGVAALQRWAAAKGTLNDSGTANALMDYGQNAATQEYQNVWNRNWDAYRGNRTMAMDTYNVNEGNRYNTYATNRAGAVQQYNTNYQTQYADPYKFAYQAAVDSWQPNMEQWRADNDLLRTGYTTDVNRIQRENELNYTNAWNKYEDEQDRWEKDRELELGPN